MSFTKIAEGFFIISVIFCAEITHGIPLDKRRVNVTDLSHHQTLMNKSSSRNPRFFGKFSLMAGVGLPNSNLVPPMNRIGHRYDQHVPTQFTAAYNFLPKQWGPYVAATYEPSSFVTFFQNSLSYLASLLNPFNWFTSSSGGPIYEVTTPIHSVTPSNKIQNSELLLLLQDEENEIPNENHILIDNKIETKTQRERWHDHKPENVMTTTISEPFTNAQEIISTLNDVDKNMELIAEETTVKLIQQIKKDINLADETRQVNRKNITNQSVSSNVPITTKKFGRQPTITTFSPTNGMTRKSTTTEIPTTFITTTTEAITTASEANTTAKTEFPQNNISTSGYKRGYYYGGYPQNVGHVEFTTPSKLTTSVSSPARLQNLNQNTRLLQQNPTNYYDSYQTQPIEHYNSFGQSFPDSNDYYKKNNKLLSNNQNTINSSGFKPSFPFHLH